MPLIRSVMVLKCFFENSGLLKCTGVKLYKHTPVLHERWAWLNAKSGLWIYSEQALFPV